MKSKKAPKAHAPKAHAAEAQAPEVLPEFIETEDQLDELLSRPPAAVVDLFRKLDGDLAIVGGGGKIGPSLAQMACRARAEAGTKQKITVIDRFPDAAVRPAIERFGAQTVSCDLLDDKAVASLPDAPNIVYMAGMKFGTSGRPELTWAVNGLIPAYVARRYKDSRIVAFSTGCVYALVDAKSAGSVETDALEPPGEYANSCVARERMFQYFSAAFGTPIVLMRLNYAVELRYGVLVDIASHIVEGQPVDLTMGHVNVIWQGDVNAATLRLLEMASAPPLALNVTGQQKLCVRELATRLGEMMGRKVKFTGKEAPTALLSDASASFRLLGKPAMPIEPVLKWVAHWIGRGGKTLGKPTHFQTRDGKY
ncbi:MAG: NAD-dependent epimerase/dehydratase family protein [Phycisphaerae bacterium]